MEKRYFELSDGSSNKFWEIWIDSNLVHTRYGRIGSAGSTTVKDAGSVNAADKLRQKLIREKTGKGYIEKGGAHVPVEPTPRAAATPLAKQTAPIPTTPPRVTVVAEPSDGMILDLLSEGDQLLIVTNRELQRSPDGKQRTVLATDQVGLAGIAARGDELWLAAYGHVLVSRDRGASFAKIDLVKGAPFYAIGCDDTGIWVAGHEGLTFLSTDGETFTKLGGLDKATFKRAVPSPFGMLLLKYNGRIALGARNRKTKATPLRCKSPLLDGCVTSTGAVVVVGHGDWNGAAFRTEDGEAFEPSRIDVKTPRPLQGIACLPDGRLIAGSQNDRLLVSYDDGRSFGELPHDGVGADRNFGVLVQHDGAVYATDSFQRLVRIE